jgi:uncharacterized protein involved in response to NO
LKTCVCVSGVGLRLFACWDCGFESRRCHGCLFLVSVLCCQVEVSAVGRSLVQRSPTDCACVCMLLSVIKGIITSTLTVNRLKETRKSPSFCLIQHFKMCVVLTVLAEGSSDVTPCGLLGATKHFEGTCCFHLQVDILGWANRNLLDRRYNSM